MGEREGGVEIFLGGRVGIAYLKKKRKWSLPRRTTKIKRLLSRPEKKEAKGIAS